MARDEFNYAEEAPAARGKRAASDELSEDDFINAFNNTFLNLHLKPIMKEATSFLGTERRALNWLRRPKTKLGDRTPFYILKVPDLGPSQTQQEARGKAAESIMKLLPPDEA